MPPCNDGSWWLPKIHTPNQPSFTIWEGLEIICNTYIHLEPLPHLVSLALVLVCEQRQSYQSELVSLEEENLLGMNTIKSSSKFLLSYHSYSSAYELDYSFCVMIMTYELVYSLCVMILTCKTLCLIIHITYMSRIRAKLRWQFIVPSGVPKFFTCRSVGSGT